MYVVTVALNEPWSVVGFVLISDPLHYVNRQGTTALGSIESDELSLAAFVKTSHVYFSLVNNSESSVIIGFSKLTIDYFYVCSKENRLRNRCMCYPW